MHALSLPTWWIHVSSVVEWIVAIFLVWTFAEVSQQRQWRGLAWAMLPSLVGAMCAVTWHFFDNAPELNWIVTGQATFTLIGNCTLAGAAFWIWQQSRLLKPEDSDPIQETMGSDGMADRDD